MKTPPDRDWRKPIISSKHNKKDSSKMFHLKTDTLDFMYLTRAGMIQIKAVETTTIN